MAEFDELTQSAARKAALRASAGAAKRAFEDMLLTDEERAARDLKRAAESKRRRTRLLAYGALGLLLLVGLIGLMLSYWHWFLLAGVIGVVGLFAVSRARKALARRKASGASDVVSSERKRPLEPVTDKPAPVAALPPKRTRAPDLQSSAKVSTASSQAEEAREVDEELAALKAKLGK